MAWVRVAGRGTLNNSSALRNFAGEVAKRGLRDFIVDLKDCELMDSTFMGTLAGIALKIAAGGKVRVIRANPRNRGVLQNLGLDRILSLEDEAPSPAPDTLRSAGPGQPGEPGRQTIIEAHENLVATNPENAVRFKDVLEFLKQEGSTEGSAP